MNISEFAKSRGLQTNTVSKYIREHASEFDGHTQVNGKAVELDDRALELLEKKYPKPKDPIVIGINKDEHYTMMAEKDDQIRALQERIIEIQQKHEQVAYRLGQLASIEDQSAKVAEELKAAQAVIAEKDRDIYKANAEIERLKSRSLWQRIRNK